MIRVASPIPEPGDFDVDCRQKGNQWLARNPDASTSKYPSYWRQFSAELEDGFEGRCGYQAIVMPEGTVDHFISKKTDASLTYEWNNYRYCGSAFNSAKQNYDDQVPDPFEVDDDWFKVILPSCQLIATDRLPASMAKKAAVIIDDPGLLNSDKARRNRLNRYREYLDGKIDLGSLKHYAPQVGAAVQKYLDDGETSPVITS